MVTDFYIVLCEVENEVIFARKFWKVISKKMMRAVIHISLFYKDGN